jgi:hypothetical protein
MKGSGFKKSTKIIKGFQKVTLPKLFGLKECGKSL